jgi:isopenicillin N synthase-like dioxygenase
VQVPIVDLASLSGADPRIGAALIESGFVVLEGHGIAPALWDRAYEASARVFALPAEVRSRYRGPEDGSQRGYLPVRTTLGDGREALDRKEAWHVRRDGHRFSNVLPVEVPEFGPVTLDLVRALDALLDRVLPGLDAFLGKPVGYFGEMVRGGDSLFRINHYPDMPADGTHLRFRAHRDFDIVTFLIGATKPGLEIQARDGAWWPLTPSANGIVINAGDILALESRGRIPSTTHRVVCPPQPDGGRISMVYFVSPRSEVRLESGISAGEFIDARLRDAGYLR